MIVKRHLLQMKAKYAGKLINRQVIRQYNHDASNNSDPNICACMQKKKKKKLSIGSYHQGDKRSEATAGRVCDELHHQQHATLSDVLLQSSDFWTSTTVFHHGESSHVPYKIFCDIVQTFLLMNRTEEEKYRYACHCDVLVTKN